MNQLNPKSKFKFFQRRMRYSIITAVILAIFSVVICAQNQTLGHSSFVTGYLLMGCIVFLAAFNLRKKLPFLPAIGSASFWMQLHIYVGLATFVIFGFHIAWQIPNGMFESFLAFLYLFVALSGVYGLYATRVYPSRLTGLNEETIFERIPAFRQRLAARAQATVLQASGSSDVLARFYANRLSHFFERPPSCAYLLRPSSRKRRQLVSEIEDLHRYLDDSHRDISRQLSEMVKQRDDLDYHYAIQGRLKIWLFAHIGLTYSLLLVGLLHMVMAHAFSGGL